MPTEHDTESELRLALAWGRTEALESAAKRDEQIAKRARRRANASRRYYERLLTQFNGQGELDFGENQ